MRRSPATLFLAQERGYPGQAGITELEAELAPFREYIAANAAETEAQADGAASPPAQVAKPKK